MANNSASLNKYGEIIETDVPLEANVVIPDQTKGVFELFAPLSEAELIRPYAYIAGVADPNLCIPQYDPQLDVHFAPRPGDISSIVGIIPVNHSGMITPPIGYAFELEDDGTFTWNIGLDGTIAIENIKRTPFQPVNIELRKLEEWSISSQGCRMYRGLTHPFEYEGWSAEDLYEISGNKNEVLFSNEPLRRLYTQSLAKLGSFVEINDLDDRIQLTHAILDIVSGFRQWQSQAMIRSTRDLVPDEKFGVHYNSQAQYLEWAARHVGKFGCSDRMAADVLGDFLQSLGIKCVVARFDNVIADDRSVAWATNNVSTQDKVVIYLPDGRVAHVDAFDTHEDQGRKNATLAMYKNFFVSNYCPKNKIDYDGVKVWSRVDQVVSATDKLRPSQIDPVYGMLLFRKLPRNFRHVLTAIAGVVLDSKATVPDVLNIINKYVNLPRLPLLFGYAKMHPNLAEMVLDLTSKWFRNGSSKIGEYGVRYLFDEQSTVNFHRLITERKGKHVEVNDLPIVLPRYIDLVSDYSKAAKDEFKDLNQMNLFERRFFLEGVKNKLQLLFQLLKEKQQ